VSQGTNAGLSTSNLVSQSVSETVSEQGTNAIIGRSVDQQKLLYLSIMRVNHGKLREYNIVIIFKSLQIFIMHSVISFSQMGCLPRSVDTQYFPRSV
jgi:hypothetical protein